MRQPQTVEVALDFHYMTMERRSIYHHVVRILVSKLARSLCCMERIQKWWDRGPLKGTHSHHPAHSQTSPDLSFNWSLQQEQLHPLGQPKEDMIIIWVGKECLMPNFIKTCTIFNDDVGEHTFFESYCLYRAWSWQFGSLSFCRVWNWTASLVASSALLRHR